MLLHQQGSNCFERTWLMRSQPCGLLNPELAWHNEPKECVSINGTIISLVLQPKFSLDQYRRLAVVKTGDGRLQCRHHVALQGLASFLLL
jgi:hypothetical protein